MKPRLDLLALVYKHRIRPSKVSPKVLESIWHARQEELAEIEAEAEALSKDFNESLAQGEGVEAEIQETALNDLSVKWKEKRIATEEARDRYYESHLALEQSRVLGSAKRVVIKDIIILTLIVFVLSLMSYEYAVPVSNETAWLFYWIDLGCCVVFLTNFFFEHHLTISKRWYWRTHWIDFVTSIPFPPMIGATEGIRSGRAIRLVRILRFARFARILRALRMALFLWRGMEQLTRVLDVRLMKRSLLMCLVVVGLGAVSIYGLEGNHQPVGNMWDSLWWSFTTTVTGGFGDIHNPMSGSGRILTVLLVIIGMILVGIFTATLTTIMMPEPEDDYDEERHTAFQNHVQEELASQRARQEEILERLKQLEGPR